MKIAINGFGRIGKNFLRALLQDKAALKKIEIVAINVGPSGIEHIAHAFKFDTLLGTYQGSVSQHQNYLIIDGKNIALFAESDPEKLPWKALSIDWVVECSGKFTSKALAQKHQRAGALKVLISAPCDDADATIIMGINEADYKKEDTIISLGSCTTNAVVPLLKVVHDTFAIQSAYMTTVHAYTNDQVLLDLDKADLRRARAAALNIIPTTTGAMKTVSKIIPALHGKLEGCSLRVPVAKVSLIDLTFVAQKPLTIDSLHQALQQAQSETLKHIIDLTDQPLVSTDFSNNSHSVVVDTLMTSVTGQLGKLFGWYDNEWAYSCRLKDFLIKYS
ncbi:MAG: type I glyceraldehyde-3-phosphate dehydrogenase [Candidatus Babeliales bacterium]|jgi:glyceraldehyde 3-phosphate dehydrogenase